MPRPFTKPQERLLNAVFLYRNINGGGSVRYFLPRFARKVAFRMLAESLITPPDEAGAAEITLDGLYALRAIRQWKYANHGCMAYLSDLKEIEKAVADREAAAATSGIIFATRLAAVA